ncbi:MAG: hypothetical protein RL291_1906 [Pseudomonadota bacterium]
MALGQVARVGKYCLGGFLALAAVGYVIHMSEQSSQSPEDRADRQFIAECKRKHDMRSKAYADCIEPIAQKIIDEANRARALR